jgi:hypothetical protein
MAETVAAVTVPCRRLFDRAAEADAAVDRKKCITEQYAALTKVRGAPPRLWSWDSPACRQLHPSHELGSSERLGMFWRFFQCILSTDALAGSGPDTRVPCQPTNVFYYHATQIGSLYLNSAESLADGKEAATSSNFAVSTLHACRQQLAVEGCDPEAWLAQQVAARSCVEITYGAQVKHF